MARERLAEEGGQPRLIIKYCSTALRILPVLHNLGCNTMPLRFDFSLTGLQKTAGGTVPGRKVIIAVRTQSRKHLNRCVSKTVVIQGSRQNQYSVPSFYPFIMYRAMQSIEAGIVIPEANFRSRILLHLTGQLSPYLSPFAVPAIGPLASLPASALALLFLRHFWFLSTWLLHRLIRSKRGAEILISSVGILHATSRQGVIYRLVMATIWCGIRRRPTLVLSRRTCQANRLTGAEEADAALTSPCRS